MLSRSIFCRSAAVTNRGGAPQQQTGRAQWCIDHHRPAILALAVGPCLQKEEAASRFLSYFIGHVPQQRFERYPGGITTPTQVRHALAVGPCRQKEEAANRFLSLLCLIPYRSNEPGEPNGVTITARPPVSYCPWGHPQITCRRAPCPGRGGRPRTGSSAAARDPQCRWSRQRSCR